MRPSAFAVFTLMTSSNLLGCCTGRSAGLAPLRKLSGVNSLEPIDVCQLWAIAEQTASLAKSRCRAMAGTRRCDASAAIRRRNPIGETLSSHVEKRCEGTIKLVLRARAQHME